MGDAQLAGILRPRGDGEAMNSQSLAEVSLKEGNRWTFREAFDLSSNGSVSILLDNAFNGATLRVISVRLSVENAITGSVSANADGVGSGTALPVQNDRIDADVATVPDNLSVESGGTYSGGEAPLPLDTTGGTGQGANRTPLNQLETANVRVEPGASLLWDIQEDSGNASKVVFTVTVSRE